MFETLLLALLLLAAWFWLDSISKREIAIQHGRDLAGHCNLQLLDETVACNRLRVARDSRGHVQLLRMYEFDVSANGADRMQCNLQLLGKQLQTWHIPPYAQAGTVLSEPPVNNVHRIH
jgi:hypothetical protein